VGEIEPGLYESLVTDELAERLESIERRHTDPTVATALALAIVEPEFADQQMKETRDLGNHPSGNLRDAVRVDRQRLTDPFRR
jgi:hypothetical protein